MKYIKIPHKGREKWGVPDAGTIYTLSFITQGITLLPGDFVATGTPAGIGPVRRGDVIGIDIPGVNTPRYTVINYKVIFWDF